MKKYLKISAFFSLFTILIVLLILDLFLHNFRVVIPNQVFRSRQLSEAQFNEKIKMYNIKSILNLRGSNPSQTWYKNELAISKQDDVNHYNIALDSDKLPTAAQFRKLVSILQTAPRPLLIHCESGVDRSGLASAVVLLLANQPLSAAQKQVSWEYFVLHYDSTGKQFMRDYLAWLKQNRLESSKAVFLEWLSGYNRK